MVNLEATQANHPIAVTSPLGDDVLLFHSMNVSEQLGRLFQFDLDLLSSDPEIKLQDIVGQNVTVRYIRPDGENRYFNGFVNQFSQAGAHGNLFVYRATLRPWFWFLTRTADCRIFQNKTVPDIIKEVFRDKGFIDFKDTLSGNYRVWENCVQYRETDFNFVSRLMEQEGIYYYFEHEDGKHTLVLSESISSHQTVSGYEEVPYYPRGESGHREDDHISDWSVNQIIQPGVYALKAFDFKKPKAKLEAKSSMLREHDQADFEIYDYPGEYDEISDGETYARARMDELQAQYEEVQGQGSVAGLMTGCLFKLTNYAREDQNREYLVTSAKYSLGPQEYESGFTGEGGSNFFCSFTALDIKQAFRPPRITPKPVVQGPQTAIVVGKAGEEIWTDNYGRVKVQFHWDRYGKKDENSSCWVRVSQVWAGSGWGSMHLPHIGHEVIVSFIEGDPDQPIITGRVYNESNKPADSLPGEQHKSVIRSFGDNDIVIDDKEGDKQIHIKQACGNEIRMNENTPDIEIRQACGNEILMHEAEGIQIRDKYGNEIILDAVAGTMKLRSPSHESVIELGKSIFHGTDSDFKEDIHRDYFTSVKGSVNTVVYGAKDEYIVGPVNFKYDGVNAKIHGGIVNDTFLGAKWTATFGAKVDTSWAKDFTRVKGAVKIDSQVKTEVIGGGGKEDTSKLYLDGEKVRLNSGKSGITIDKDGDIEIFSDKTITVGHEFEIDAEAEEAKLFGLFKTNKKTKLVSFTGSSILKHKNLEVKN